MATQSFINVNWKMVHISFDFIQKIIEFNSLKLLNQIHKLIQFGLIHKIGSLNSFESTIMNELPIQ